MKASRLWDTENPSSAETKKGFRAKDYASLIKGLELVEKTEHNLGGLGLAVFAGFFFHCGLMIAGPSVKVRALRERIGITNLENVGVSRAVRVLGTNVVVTLRNC